MVALEPPFLGRKAMPDERPIPDPALKPATPIKAKESANSLPGVPFCGAGGPPALGERSAPGGDPHFTPIPGAKKYKSVGDYEIVSKLGRGGMGSVYLAIRKSTGEQVALKILL